MDDTTPAWVLWSILWATIEIIMAFNLLVA